MNPLAEAKQLFADALSFQQKGGLEQAADLYEKALSLAPNRPSIMNNLAAAYFELKKYAESRRLYESLLLIDPKDLSALFNLGNCQNQLDLVTEALATYEKILQLAPDHAGTLQNRGNILLELGRADEALASYDTGLFFQPGQATLLNSRGNALLELGQVEAAQICFEQARVARPDYAAAYTGLGLAFHAQGRWQESEASHQQALALAPADAAVKYNLALTLLFRQEFEQAWLFYGQRFHYPAIRKGLRKDTAEIDFFAGKAARADSDQVGQTAIWAEQGIGDQVLFSTLIPELIAEKAPFIYEVDRRLLRAYQRAFPASCFVAQESPVNEALRGAKYALAAGSLPGLFRRSRKSFARQPTQLLGALPERKAYFRGRMDALGPGLKVAFSWQSTRGGQRGRSKSASLLQFAPLLELADVGFVDVQYGDTQIKRSELERLCGVRILHFDEIDYYRDLEDVLAILEACDLLITTSNANAHFAGALGKPVWLLYLEEKPPFHYWAHDGSHRCLWYPSVEIISAPQCREWPQLVGHVKERLSRDADRFRQGA